MIDTVIDFETYYDKEISVARLGNHNYAKASDAYMLSIVNDEIQDVGTVAEIGNKYGRLFTDPNIQFWGANSNFDLTFFEKDYGPSANPWKCILDVCAGQQIPRSLAGAILSVFGRKVDKSQRAAMQGVCYEAMPAEEQQKTLDYCLQDSIEEFALLRKLRPLTAVEDAVAMQTRLLNQKGIRVNLELIEADKTRLERLRWESFRAVPWSAGEAPLSATALSRWAAHHHGVETPKSLAKGDEEFEVWAAMIQRAHPAIAGVVRAMATYRKSNTLLKKLQTCLNRLTDAGRMPMDLLYCGAPHTRRWSSRGFNIQNLDRSPIFCDQMAELFPEECDAEGKHAGIWTRRWIIPDEGCVFGILDFSQIEPRCLADMVGDHALLQAVRDGFPIYEAHARTSMGWKGGKLKEEDEDLYRLAKARVLGLGYGCGAEKFQFVARIMAGLELTPEQALTQTNDFRRSNPLITKYWSALDSQLANAYRRERGDRHLSFTTKAGETLTHYDLEKRIVADPKKKGKTKSTMVSYKAYKDPNAKGRVWNLWGGLLTENITQRYARDVLADSLVRMEDAGIELGFHAHDEVILQLDKSSAEADLKEVENIMCTNPAWCGDVPLAVEGGLHEHYVK
jgi:DNA polymerase